MFFSDENLKEDIELVGRESGFNIYEFKYKDSGKYGAGRYRGVMAQEVELSYPDAVFTRTDGVFNGYKTVDYGMLGIQMKEVS